MRHTRKGILRVEILVPENIPGNIPDPENIPRGIPARGSQEVLQFQGLTKNIPNIPNIPVMSGMRMDAFECTYLHKETLNFTLLIYICVRPPNPRNPERRGDFGDIGDIFGKPSDHAGLRVLGSGDTLGMSPGDGDVGDVGDALSHARKGASGDDLSPTVGVAVFSRFRGPKTLRRVSVRLASKSPKKGRFGGLIRGRIESTGAARTKGILRVEIPGSDVKRIRPGDTSHA